MNGECRCFLCSREETSYVKQGCEKRGMSQYSVGNYRWRYYVDYLSLLKNGNCTTLIAFGGVHDFWDETRIKYSLWIWCFIRVSEEERKVEKKLSDHLDLVRYLYDLFSIYASAIYILVYLTMLYHLGLTSGILPRVLYICSLHRFLSLFTINYCLPPLP